jgi:hypothetical protein
MRAKACRVLMARWGLGLRPNPFSCLAWISEKQRNSSAVALRKSIAVLWRAGSFDDALKKAKMTYPKTIRVFRAEQRADAIERSLRYRYWLQLRKISAVARVRISL